MKANKECSLCENQYTQLGHNPWPVINVNRHPDARCCDDCNTTKVTPMRMVMIMQANQINNIKKDLL